MPSAGPFPIINLRRNPNFPSFPKSFFPHPPPWIPEPLGKLPRLKHRRHSDDLMSACSDAPRGFFVGVSYGMLQTYRACQFQFRLLDSMRNHRSRTCSGKFVRLDFLRHADLKSVPSIYRQWKVAAWLKDSAATPSTPRRHAAGLHTASLFPSRGLYLRDQHAPVGRIRWAAPSALFALGTGQ